MTRFIYRLSALLLMLGATYVARSFSGDRKQLTPLIQGALAHAGSAILDVISPCVTFNNHEDSTKSYKWAKEHEIPIQEIGENQNIPLKFLEQILLSLKMLGFVQSKKYDLEVWSAGQKRDESGVRISSIRCSLPAASTPNSNLVSAMMMPRVAA